MTGLLNTLYLIHEVCTSLALVITKLLLFSLACRMISLVSRSVDWEQILYCLVSLVRLFSAVAEPHRRAIKIDLLVQILK